MISLVVVNLLTLLFLSNFCILRISTESIHDLPWSVDKGNWIITAKLISSNDGVFDIREYVHSSEVVRGKITISSGDDTMDIFYSSEFKNDRLVIQNQQCFGFNLKNKWDHKLFNIDSTKPLLNHLLMTGPSIVFRINGKNFIWRQDEDTNINGFAVHSANTTFNRNLDIIYYYKTHLDSPGILKASRLQFNGLDSPFELITSSEIVNLDIYSITKTQEELDKIVTVTPGIGCPLNLITSKSHDWFQIPEMSGSSYHFVAKTTVDGPKKSITLSEMFVNSQDLTTSMKTIEQGIVTESLYDYNLGTIYSLTKEGRCLISGIGPNSPGISIYGAFTTYGFLNYRDTHTYSYLGKTYIRSRYEAYVWERTDYDYAFEGEKYDKFVTSHYFIKSTKAKLFNDFILVRTTTNNYKKVNSETYKLIETITKDYYGLEVIESGHDYKDELSLNFADCYPDSKERKTFAIYFTCENDEDLDCLKYAETHHNMFNANLKTTLARENISPARISNIDLVFEDRNIKALVTFLKIPNIEDSLQKETIKLSQSTISSLNHVIAESVGDCLYKIAGLKRNPKAIAYCNQEKTSIVCGWLASKETIVRDAADAICDVYYPIDSYSQFNKEIHLNKLGDILRRKKLHFYLSGDAFISYESTRIIDVTNEISTERGSFILVASEKKLIDTDVDVILAKDISNLGDCYRTCAHDDVNLCETFVYCQATDKSSCFTSNIIYANLSKRTTEDASCKIYSKNRLLDYIEISSREFKQSTSITIDVPLDNCASMCSSSDECFSFQQCGGSCTLSGYYTDSISQESSDCNIYIPKVSQQFISTGRKIVSEVFHTEVNLNLDQCAALCYSWTNTGESCVSFNYCPKNGEISSCSLSKYSTNDKSATSIDSGVCKNYEKQNLQSHERNVNENVQVTVGGISRGAAFGIILLFITVGLLLGFIFPMLINVSLMETFTCKINFSSPSKQEIHEFGWTKQIDSVDIN
ncbi:uncharacterized protein LOC128390309 [Panonychus citri]|uniref:uncharacterized protein LOC128390309 n=1 Tax=Panonychus citri TaxID=50023 RepID=UPI0023081C91|nr:uncharacterized protein LOC128390309 [Panonychus citri]